MKSSTRLSPTVFLALPLIVAPGFADEPVEIPFHLAKGQLLYEKYCGACHDGGVAWPLENCDLCHSGRPGLATGVKGGHETMGPGVY